MLSTIFHAPAGTTTDAAPATDEAFDLAIIRAMVPALTPIEREILRRHILAGEQLVDIARALGTSRVTIGRRWREVRRQLSAA